MDGTVQLSYRQVYTMQITLARVALETRLYIHSTSYPISEKS